MTSRTNSTRVTYNPDAPSARLVGENPARTNLVVTNRSGVELLLLFSEEPCSEERYTYRLGPGDVLDLGVVGEIYTGTVTYCWAAATGGAAMVSEWHRTL